jgi:hypothetical protein
MASTPTAPTPPVWVRFLATIDPTPVDRTRYEAGSVWHMPIDRAQALIDANPPLAELVDPPAAATRVVTEPLEPVAPIPDVSPAAIPAPAEFAAEEE